MLSELVSRWQRQGAGLRPPLTEERLVSFEEGNGADLPAPVRSYLRTVDGQDDPLDGFRFWPFDEWTTIEQGAPAYSGGLEPLEWFLFADYLVSSIGYAISLRKGSDRWGTIIALGGKEHDFAAKSFEDFVRAYLNDFDSLTIL